MDLFTVFVFKTLCTYTYSTLTLLRKWNFVHIYSCTIHVTHTPWQTLNLSNDGTHVPCMQDLFCWTCPLHMHLHSIELVICMYMYERPLILFSISVCDWTFVLVVPSLFIHDVDNFSHACGAPLWLVLCTYHATWDSQQLSLRRNATVLFIHSRRCLCLACSAFVLDTCSEFHLLFLTTRCSCSVTVLST